MAGQYAVIFGCRTSSTPYPWEEIPPPPKAVIHEDEEGLADKEGDRNEETWLGSTEMGEFENLK